MGFTNTVEWQIHGEEIVPEPQKVAQSNSDQTGPVKRKPQFSIRNLLVWTTIVSIGVVITTATLSEVGYYDIGVLLAITNLSIYIVAVCGLWMLVKNLKSFDFWIPAGMSVFLPVFFLLYSAGQFGESLLEGISAVMLFLGVPYGIGLLALMTRRTSKWGFSLTMLVFCVGAWLWWMACAAIVWIGASGALL
tara:strand:- start:393 stop:968 length:576 start_codon:yes stop_codon:yes gene_type:complete